MNRVKQLVHAENVYRMGYTGKNIRVVTLDTSAAECGWISGFCGNETSLL